MLKRFIAFFFLVWPVISYSQCCLWNMNRLKAVKEKAEFIQYRSEIIARADGLLPQEPLTVIDTEKPLVSDKHYYFSMPAYWWYDETEGKYVRHDGIRNESNAVFDSQKIVQLTRRLKYFSVSYYITGEQKYIDAYRRQLKVWFIDDQTKMYPNFEYAQLIPGQNDNKGRSVGLIDGYCLNEVVESFRLITYYCHYSIPEENEFKLWFSDLTHWLLTSWQGIKISQGVANSSVSYDVMLANFSLFVGLDDVLIDVTDSFCEKRLKVQITDDGRQPEELTRTKAYSYSIMNLSHIMDFCLLQSSRNNDYYGQNTKLIEKAYKYLNFYKNKENKWPYQQITSWESEVEKLNSVSVKREYLQRNSSKFWFRNLFRSKKQSINNYESEVINKVLN